jgi:hypothetical protein
MWSYAICDTKDMTRRNGDGYDGSRWALLAVMGRMGTSQRGKRW